MLGFQKDTISLFSRYFPLLSLRFWYLLLLESAVLVIRAHFGQGNG